MTFGAGLAPASADSLAAAAPRSDLTTALRRQGYSDFWSSVLMRLKNYLPPVTDLVRFAVREVYNPKLRAELGLDSE